MKSQQFFNDEILKKRIETFYGYGNYDGKYWFIGMEEAGGENFENINFRINTWEKRGKNEIDDVAEYHEDMGWWDKKIQRTWNGLIRILLSAKGIENIDRQDVREYQFNKLGRKNEETCLLELFPLPSPSIDDWIYSKYSKLPFLCDRDTYKKYCVEKRINHISQRIKEDKPQVVVFYGIKFEYCSYWRKITNIEFTKKDSKNHYFFIGRNNQTIFVIAFHPSYRGKGFKHEYFHNIGKSITAKLA